MNYPTGCLLNSNYYLESASTVAGNTTFTDYSGSSTTGHSGNGAIRITVINRAGGIFVKTSNTSWNPISSIYVKIDNSTWVKKDMI